MPRLLPARACLTGACDFGEAQSHPVLKNVRPRHISGMGQLNGFFKLGHCGRILFHGPAHQACE